MMGFLDNNNGGSGSWGFYAADHTWKLVALDNGKRRCYNTSKDEIVAFCVNRDYPGASIVSSEEIMPPKGIMTAVGGMRFASDDAWTQWRRYIHSLEIR